MALPTTGPLAMSQVNTELGTTGSINLGREDVKKLAGVEQGTIKMSDLRGKSSLFYSGRLSIGKSKDMVSFGYSNYNIEDVHGNLTPIIFDDDQSIVYLYIYSDFKIKFLILPTEGAKLKQYNFIKMKINNKTYTLQPTWLYYESEPDKELYDYFKVNYGKTIQIDIVEAQLK